MTGMFAQRVSIEQIEEGFELAPKFDADGLLPVVTTSAKTGEVLMLGYMTEEALKLTIQTGEAHYYSRSRKKLWRKGADSGLLQIVKEIRVDDDQDAVWISVEIDGPYGEASCHVGYRSCFYRSVAVGQGEDKPAKLEFEEDELVFDPKEVYGDAPNPTQV
ncbi:MAG: phosphoribosyl-AMP cyclohydrolase [Micavibrio sp. TMED2]|nr:phosphoribosyl-AMP cyclohydrolase [Alphaproteobacteria bacterium]MAS47919.1 phosphoribosyl-AMP cyclohydrolase [Alphaproteobacteria bacterium]MAX97195.1 phosphoribosyl-AMP cyclohydrolase [Alphaproteobacteria bacterium]OUT40049.1 MAG: phosphoribosyl-AMP cyclohydrolase [Micavibrio sp. TMED2]|tara:strand:- start:10706 stop:11188 length:483 start_codon:yes stop_codon:yes gene_type:complete